MIDGGDVVVIDEGVGDREGLESGEPVGKELGIAVREFAVGEDQGADREPGLRIFRRTVLKMRAGEVSGEGPLRLGAEVGEVE
jgi:hypothetical protein